MKPKQVVVRLIVSALLLYIGSANFLNHLNQEDFGLLNLNIYGNISELTVARFGELLRGDIVSGKFYSKYSDLGLVLIRFFNQDRDSNDVLVFRIKEEGEKKWYYEAQYKTDQFLPHKLFPFGFPPVTESAGKIFLFEIESLSGTPGNGVMIDNQKPVFVAKSIFTKDSLLKEKIKRDYFLQNKLINFFGDRETILNIIFIFLPFTYYMLFISSKKFNHRLLTALILFFTVSHIILIKEIFDPLLLADLFFWLLICFRYRFEPKISACYSLIYLFITLLFFTVGSDNLAEKSAFWASILLCTTVIQHIYISKTHQKDILTVKNF